jgi:hypothetical protein
MANTIYLNSDFTNMLSEFGHDSDQDSVDSIKLTFVNHVNNSVKKDDAGNTITAKNVDTGVEITFTSGEFFTEGDIDGIFETFFEDL